MYQALHYFLFNDLLLSKIFLGSFVCLKYFKWCALNIYEEKKVVCIFHFYAFLDSDQIY